MPMLQYCWRCQTEMPMLNESEWAELHPFLSNFNQSIKAYRQTNDASLPVAFEKGHQDPALKKYFDLTGFQETNVNALWHHRLALYGPPCSRCGRLLRTPRAKFCAECGSKLSLAHSEFDGTLG